MNATSELFVETPVVDTPVDTPVEKKKCVFISKAGVQCYRMVEGEMCNLHAKQSNKSDVFDESLGKQCSKITKSGKRCMLVCDGDSDMCKMCGSQALKVKAPVVAETVGPICSYVTKAGDRCTHTCKSGDMCVMHTHQIKGAAKTGKVTEKFLETDAKTKVAQLTEVLMKSGSITPEMSLIMSMMSILIDKMDTPSSDSRVSREDRRGRSRAPSSDSRVSRGDRRTRTPARSRAPSSDSRVSRGDRRSRTPAPSSDSRVSRGDRKVQVEVPDEKRCVHINKKTEKRCHKYCCNDSDLCGMHFHQCGKHVAKVCAEEVINENEEF